MKTGTITKITSLRQRNDHNSDKVKLHHFIVIYLNNLHTRNKCITNDYYIEYLHYATEQFIPQFQLTQCFEYDHRATQCKRQSRCGKCGDKHNTRDCKSTTVHCAQCNGQHEAWYFECPARIAESQRLEEQMKSSSCLFD